MSDSETTDPIERTGVMETPSDDPKRSVDGMVSVAELRARATRGIADANVGLGCAIAAGLKNWVLHEHGQIAAFQSVLAWLDDLNGCDVASTDKAGGRNS